MAGTLGVGQAKAGRMLEHGRRAVGLFGRALELLERGMLRAAAVEMLLYLTAKHSEAVQAETGARVIDALADCDAADARALIVATLLEVEADLDPEGVAERHAQARANRGVWVKPVEDGMVRIGAEVDQLAAHRFQLDLDELCRAQKVADEQAEVQRSAEQRRADVLAELPGRHLALLQAFQQGKTLHDLVPASSVDPRAALFALPVRNPARLYVHSPMSTLLELDNRAGWVEGLGPISAHHARLLRPSAELQAVWVDADTGIPLGVDPTVHPPVGEPDWADPREVVAAAEQVRTRLRSMLRPTTVEDRAEAGRAPSSALSRQLQVRDVRCTGVGCPRHGHTCEQDHLREVSEGGPTAIWNLDLKSPRCHHARHQGWCAMRDPRTGATVWISPAGGRYTRRSPWRPPPRITTPLPPASLDPPDHGKARTFGTEPAKGSGQPGQHHDSAPHEAPLEDQELTERDRAVESEPRRKTALDRAREAAARQPPCEPSNERPWGRPWHTDGPPPF